jgi:two-component system chemotaxis response regulator CheB
MISVLVVDDSAVVREFLVHVLEEFPDIRVAGTARNGEEAVAMAAKLHPDVITMDIHMPRMDGLTATRRIMETNPTRIIIVSGSSSAREVASTFHALEAGAVAFVQRPRGYGSPEHLQMAGELAQTVRLMSEVRVVRRWPSRTTVRLQQTPSSTAVPPNRVHWGKRDVQMIAVGSSTGGPMAIQTMLSGLKPGIRVPMLIVQHMSPGFVDGFAGWLASSTGIPVTVASDGSACEAGHVYVAPDDYHLELSPDKRIALTRAEPENGVRPSVCRLFRSAAAAFEDAAVGVLLTGMGRDGADGLRIMRESGAVTIAQDEKSSVVFGMPGTAVALGAAMHVLPPEDIAVLLKKLAGEP